jgi:FkbM family methyltransferase
VNYYSQFGQDKFIYETYFKMLGKRDGTFLDIGASHPEHLNNTLFFEKLGWTGVAIEPMEEDYTLLKEHRKCICENVAISPTSGTREFLQLTGYTKLLSGFVDSYDPRHRERINRELSQFGGTQEIINVRCLSLGDLLEKHSITHIDYMSLDTEGSELEILQSIDFDKTPITCISVENNYKDDRLPQFLASKNYKKVADLGCDEIYYKA